MTCFSFWKLEIFFLYLWFLNFIKICLDVGFSLLSYLGLCKSFPSGVFHLLFLFLPIFPPLSFFFYFLEFHYVDVSTSVYLQLIVAFLENFLSLYFLCCLPGEFLNVNFSLHILSSGLSIQLFIPSIYFNYYSYTIFLFVYFYGFHLLHVSIVSLLFRIFVMLILKSWSICPNYPASWDARCSVCYFS